MTMPSMLRFTSRSRRERPSTEKTQHNKLFYILLAAPGIIWLTLLFLVPFYDVLAIAGGRLNFLTESPVAVYNPLNWSHATLITTWHDIFGVGSFELPIIWRTIWYTAVAAGLCLLIGYPAAYFVARFAGRRKALFLVLLIAPFWISYMMRMLAWIDLLQTNGYLNKALGRDRPAQHGQLARREVVHGHPRPGLRLHPVPDPGAVRGAGPDRRLAAGGRPRSRPRPDQDVREDHAAAVPAADPDRDADHRAADARRLLHQHAAVRHTGTPR